MLAHKAHVFQSENECHFIKAKSSDSGNLNCTIRIAHYPAVELHLLIHHTFFLLETFESLYISRGKNIVMKRRVIQEHLFQTMMMKQSVKLLLVGLRDTIPRSQQNNIVSPP